MCVCGKTRIGLQRQVLGTEPQSTSSSGEAGRWRKALGAVYPAAQGCPARGGSAEAASAGHESCDARGGRARAGAGGRAGHGGPPCGEGPRSTHTDCSRAVCAVRAGIVGSVQKLGQP